jgi:hypothetical protein
MLQNWIWFIVLSVIMIIYTKFFMGTKTKDMSQYSQYFRSMFQRTVNFLRTLMDTPPNSKTYPVLSVSCPAIPRILGTNEWEKQYQHKKEVKTESPSPFPTEIPVHSSVSLHSPVSSIPPYRPYHFQTSQQRVLQRDRFNKFPQTVQYVYPFPSPLREEKKLPTAPVPTKVPSTFSTLKATKASFTIHSPASTSSHRSKNSRKGSERENTDTAARASAHTSISNITGTLLALRGLNPKHPLAEHFRKNKLGPTPAPYTLFGRM